MRLLPRSAIPPTLAACGLLSALLQCSCSPWPYAAAAVVIAVLPNTRINHLYNGAYDRTGRDSTLAAEPSQVRRAFLEIDDHGWFRDPAQARGVLDSVQALAARGNVAVVLYVHGWRHNAAPRDEDVRAFSSTVLYLGEALQDETFRELRERSSGDPSVTVFGIYVGWRGKTWPEIPAAWINAINLPIYFTFWSRKAAAERVGHGELSDMVRSLDALQRAVADRKKYLVSLVMIGHSFGGHALFDATRDLIEANMASEIAGHAGPTSEGAGTRVYAANDTAGKVQCLRLVHGLGDLVVLINPAIEAASYHRVDDMIQHTTFRSDQTPVLMTVSATSDAARTGVFRVGQKVQTLGQPGQGGKQSKMLGRALGSYDPQVTHRLFLTDDTSENRKLASLRVLDRKPGDPTPPPEDLQAEAEQSVKQLREGVAPVGAPDSLFTLEARSPDFTIAPAIVVQCTPQVISGHSDFFRVEFIRWLSNFVLESQRKKVDAALKREGK